MFKKYHPNLEDWIFRWNYRWFKNNVLYMIAVILLAGFVPSESVAQISRLKIGDRIKVSANDIFQGKLIGYVVEQSSSGILLARDSTHIRLPFNTIRRVYISKGQKSLWKLGYGLGVISGGIIGSLFKEKPRCTDCLDFTFVDNLRKILVGGAIGSVVGTIVGFQIKTERWERISLSVSPDQNNISMDGHIVNPAVSFRLSLNFKP